MPYSARFRTALPISIAVIMFGHLAGQTNGGDLLNESPLSPIPAEMTFEEYRDMNRRLTVGLVLAAVPVPGMIHFYAGEKKTGWVIFGSALAGVASVVAGASSLEDGKFPKSDYDLFILNADADNERQYEKIPSQISGPDTTYRLREIFRKKEGGGGLLIVLGIAVIAGDILYDYVHGIKTIEQKRDRVRFKYGKLLSDVNLDPWLDPRSGTVGLQLSFALN